MKLSRSELEAKIRSLGFWYQNFQLQGVWTNPTDPRAYNPEARWSLIESHIPKNLAGGSVLDLGCNAGFFAVKMKERGAGRVLGVESDAGIVDQARLVAEILGHDMEFRCQDSHEFCVETTERFDYVLLLGLLYHIRYPLLVLDRLSQITNEMLILQTIVKGPAFSSQEFKPIEDIPSTDEKAFDDPLFPRMYFIEKRYSGDPSNWWIPNESCVIAMLRSSGFKITAHVGREIYICRPPRVSMLEGYRYRYEVFGQEVGARLPSINSS